MASKRRVTIQQIAEHVGLSPTTISQALAAPDGNPLVSEETHRRVWEVAREMGYPFERLRTRRPGVKRVGLFCGESDVLFYPTVIRVCALLAKQGLLSVFHSGEGSPATWYDVADGWYRRRQIGGAIIMTDDPTGPDEPREDFPCVSIGETRNEQAVWRVSADNEAGGRAVGEHLWELGHRRVGFIGARGNIPCDKRLQGFRSVWLRRGVQVPDEWIVCLDDEGPEKRTGARLRQFLERARRQGQPITALFAWHDRTALRVLNCLADEGVAVPEAMSVVGFDDYAAAVFSRPGLTTVRQPTWELGAEAIHLLMRRFQTPRHPPRVRRLAGELVVRGSTGPATDCSSSE